MLLKSQKAFHYNQTEYQLADTKSQAMGYSLLHVNDSEMCIRDSFNPVSMINEDTFENNKKLLQGTAKGTLDITKDLKWNLSLSYQDEQYIWNEYHTSKSRSEEHTSELQSQR